MSMGMLNRALPALITRVDLLSPTVKRIQLRLDRSQQEPQQQQQLRWFQPGQWADFWLAGDPTGPVGGYTFTGDARRSAHGEVEFCVQAERKRRGTSMTSWVHSAQCQPGVRAMLRPGGKWLVKPPRRDECHKAILIAAGIGVTPFLSFARTFRDDKEADIFERVELKYSVKRPEDALFLEELAEVLPTTLFLTGASVGEFAKARAAVPRTVSVVQDRRLLVANDLVHGPRGGGLDACYYLCGPPAFSDGVGAELRSLGCHTILYENWWAPASTSG